MQLRLGALLAVFGLLGVAAVPAVAVTAPPPTLTGETFSHPGTNTPGMSNMQCTTQPDGSVSGTITASGVATGPYPGTFTEQGSFAQSSSGAISFSATFTIDSGTTIVTGSESQSGLYAFLYCSPTFSSSSISGQYMANIKLASGSAYSDSGTTSVSTYQPPAINPGSGASFAEYLVSSQTATTPVAPTSKSDCQNGGYQQFGFQNQGQCIKYVNQHGG
jgi:hypothetical protein